jgi:hypothetical protein
MGHGGHERVLESKKNRRLIIYLLFIFFLFIRKKVGDKKYKKCELCLLVLARTISLDSHAVHKGRERILQS